MNIYRLLADLVVLAHVTYVAFILLGMLAIVLGLAFRWRWVRNFWFRIVHFAMIALVAAESLLGVVCPLTTLENFLRVRAGGTEYTGSFVGRWLHELLFFEAPAWAFTVCYCAFAALVLATLIGAPPHWPGRRRPTGRERAGSPA